MSIKQNAIRGGVWSAVQNGGTQAGALIVFFCLARLLEPKDFGLVALASVALAFMQIFLEQGFAQALIQRQDLAPEDIDTAFWTNSVIGVLLTVLGVTTANLIANFFEQPQLTPILQWFSLLFLISSFAKVQQALLERQFAFKAIAVRSLLGTVVGGIAGVGAAFAGFGVWSLVILQIVTELVGTLVLWYASNWRPRFVFSLTHFQHLFSFGIHILGINFLGFVSTRADDFLIGYFLGPVALGYYSLAYRVLTVLTILLVNTSNQVALPTFSRLQQDLPQFRRAFYQATQITSSIAFPTFIAIAILAPELIQLIFGQQWLPSVPVLQVLAFVGILRSISHFKSSVFIAMGKSSWQLWLSSFNTILNLIGFAIAVRWGIVAVAWAYLIRCCLVVPIGQWAVSRLIQTPLLTYLRQFVAPLSSSLVMAITILCAKQLLEGLVNSHVLLAICIVIGTIVYGLTIRLFSPKLFQKLLDKKWKDAQQ